MLKTPDDAPLTVDFHPWPRPIPAQYLSILHLAVPLVLITILLLTVAPSLSILLLLVNVLIFASVFRRTGKQGTTRKAAPD